MRPLRTVTQADTLPASLPLQVMERLFTLLSNLDTGPSHRSTDQQAKPELLVQSTHLGKVS